MAAVMESNIGGKCKKHTESIQGLCDTCDEVVCVKCMMGHHNGHTFTDLEAKVEEKRGSLQGHMLEIKKRIPVLQQRVAELSIQDDKNQRDTEAVIASITQKGESIRSKLDNIISSLIANAENQRKDTARQLSGTQEVTEDLIAKGNSFLESVEDRLKHSSHLEIIQLEKECAKLLMKMSEDHLIFHVATPRFVGGEESVEKLQSMVGDFYSDLASSLKLMSYVRIDSTLTPCESDIFISKICQVSNTEAWVKGFREDELKMYNKQGKLLKTMPLKPTCHDFATTKSGMLMTVDPKMHCVQNLNSEGESATLIDFPEGLLPISIYVNRTSGNFLVGLVDSLKYSTTTAQNTRLLKRFSFDGQELQTIQYQTKKSFFGRQTSSNIFSYPYRIAENEQTGDIAVINWTGDFTGELVVLSKDGEVIFRHSQTEDEDTFSPWDVAFDVLGNIVVSDRYSRNIQMFKISGKAKCILHKCSYTPHAIEAFPDGKLWIGHSNGKISIIQYME
ncbi:uncharacterized protein LOC134269027 [Saccostrea cucullata]|uniref:uncharacterized protein LOC134269027 n=1 Tax=Saccostrea cuccullata TaxID=36930 RepID=UPI002ED625BC